MEVYKVVNKRNGKVYIGSTIRTKEERWKEHVLTAKRGKVKKSIYKDINEFGELAFELITEEYFDNIDVLELRSLERKYIQKYIDELGRDKIYNHSINAFKGVYTQEGLLHQKNNISFSKSFKLKYNELPFRNKKELREHILRTEGIKISLTTLDKWINNINSPIADKVYPGFREMITRISNEEYILLMNKTTKEDYNKNIPEHEIHLEYLKRTFKIKVAEHPQAIKVSFDNNDFYFIKDFLTYILQTYNIDLSKSRFKHRKKNNQLYKYNELIPDFDKRIRFADENKEENQIGNIIETNSNTNFDSDVSDDVWNKIKFLFLNYPICKYSKRLLINAILYKFSTDCSWYKLPKEFPKGKYVHTFYTRLKQSDLGKTILKELGLL